MIRDKKEPMNIALIELSHMTVGVQINTVPLAVGFIAHYLKNHASHTFDIKLFKNPAKFTDALKEWRPDVLGIGQYPWNEELNLHMARLVKKINPHCLVVAGGPNLFITPEEKFAYLKKNDFVDVCVSCDGERPFAEIVKRLIAGEKIADIQRSPSPSTYAIDLSSDKLVESSKAAARLNTLDIFGSMYADGFFDEHLDDGFHPFLQTQRGCPFRCTYCRAGDAYYSKIIFQSAEYFRKDMEYLGKCFSGQHGITLYLANSNFGLFKVDFEIAQVIREIQDKYDWPKNIYVPSGKNIDILLKMLSVLKYKFPPTLSLQTLTPKVLKNIRRKNIPFEDFAAFQKKAIQTIGDNPATELILNLPGETKKSFLKTISLVLNSGAQNISVWTLMSLRGTPIASRETQERYGHLIRHRLVPRCFSDIDGLKIFDTEEVVVGTSAMPFEDYTDLRGIAFLIVAFVAAIETFPVRKFMLERGLDIARWLFNIQKHISEFPNINNMYKSYLQETRDELFTSRQALIDFFSKQENYDLLLSGHRGDNLLRKYKTMVLSEHYKEYLEIVFSELRQMVNKHTGQALNPLIDDLELYLRTRDIGHVFKDGYGEQRILQKITLHYDIPRWLTLGIESKPLENYKGVFSYSTVITDYMRNRLAGIKQLNRGLELSRQTLYRDGYIKDLWPVWVSDNNSTDKNLS